MNTRQKLRIGLMGLAAKPMPEPEGAVSPPGLVCYQLAKGLQQRGHSVTIFSGSDSRIDERTGLTLVSNDLPSPWQLYGPENANPISYTERRAELDLIHSTEAIARYKAGALDIIHSHDIRLNAYLFKQSDVPILYTPHYHLPSRNDPYDTYRYDQMRQMKTGFVHMSKQNIEYTQKLDIPVFGYAANGVDLVDFPYSDGQREGVLVVAVISQRKMIRQSILAAKLAGESITVIGPVGSKDDDQAYYDELKAEFAHDASVHFLGYLERSMIVPYYQKAKVLLYPSLNEGMPLTILEAMATGLPVIGSNVSGIPDIITDGQDGFLINETRPELMAEKIKQIDQIDNRQVRCKIEQFFTIDHMVNSYEEAYYNFLENQPYDTTARPRI